MQIVLLILLILIFVILSQIFTGNKWYERARLLEKKGNYKKACYEYAIAIRCNTIFRKICRNKIKYLWEKYGPFDYTDVLEDIKKNDTPEECGAVHHAIIISIIEQVKT